MLCQFCKKREATIHFTNVTGTRVEKIHICPACADEKGFDYLKKSNFEKGDLLAGLVDLTSGAAGAARKADRCTGCGRTYDDFKKTGKLGCSVCYETFSSQLEKILKSIHGDTKHIGKIPGKPGARSNNARILFELQKELRNVIEAEQYERAAEIRDRIKELTGGEGEGAD